MKNVYRDRPTGDEAQEQALQGLEGLINANTFLSGEFLVDNQEIDKESEVFNNDTDYVDKIVKITSYGSEDGLIDTDILRSLTLVINDGTNANTLKIRTADRYNHTAIAEVNNIVKNATTSGFTLSSDGEQLTIENSILEGVVTGLISQDVSINDTALNLVANAFDSGGDLVIQVYTVAAPAVRQDLTALTDISNFVSLRIRLAYTTQFTPFTAGNTKPYTSISSRVQKLTTTYEDISSDIKIKAKSNGGFRLLNTASGSRFPRMTIRILET